jgi:N-acetylmuramoyl-L-alanine amidase
MKNAIFSFFCFLVLVCECSCSRNLPEVYPSVTEVSPLIAYEVLPPVRPLAITPSTMLPRVGPGPLIVIDPGHGGKDLGTEAPMASIFKEKNLNLITAKILDGYLKQMGFRTIMTRTNDSFVSLEARANMANENQADLFISLHYNSAPSSQAEGIEVFYYRLDSNKERVASSKKLAESVLRHAIDLTEAKSRGVKHGDLAVIRRTEMPAVLIEGGFMTNHQEMNRLRDPSYIKSIAWGVARGIQVYFNQTRGVPYMSAQG